MRTEDWFIGGDAVFVVVSIITMEHKDKRMD